MPLDSSMPTQVRGSLDARRRDRCRRLNAITVLLISDFFSIWLKPFIIGFALATPVAYLAAPLTGKIVAG